MRNVLAFLIQLKGIPIWQEAARYIEMSSWKQWSEMFDIKLIRGENTGDF